MKKIFVFLLIIAALISGCSFNIEVVTPVPGQSDSTPSANVVASPIATISATAELPPVGFTPVSSDPVFYAAAVSLNQSGVPARIAFPMGTKQVFAIWTYQNMRAGLTIKREWYLNGEPWLFREEPRDFAKYGAAGIMSGISIYDFEVGLPSGLYELKVYIDNIVQPIGPNTPGGPETFLIFEILRDEFTTDVASPNSQWSAGISFGNRLVIRDATGAPTEIFAGREIAYLSWFPDSQHVLFVDRDRTQQKPGTDIGIRDDLWIADVQTGKTNLLYKNESAFRGHGGPVASPDGKYIASLEGSGYGDACFVDSRLIFFELADDFQSVQTIKQDQFTGLPTAADSFVYPVEDGEWKTNNLYLVTLDGTCAIDKSKMGPYLFNVLNLTAAKSSSSTTPLTAGDLGWGGIHGMIIDSVTHKPVVGAMVSCEHHSYTSPVTCSGTATTNADGIYIFDTVFFHDTDTIKLTAQAPGYQVFEYTQNIFTTNDMETNLSLTRLP